MDKKDLRTYIFITIWVLLTCSIFFRPYEFWFFYYINSVYTFYWMGYINEKKKKKREKEKLKEQNRLSQESWYEEFQKDLYEQSKKSLD